MTVFGALRRSSIEGPQPLTDASLAEWLTGATADTGVSVTERRVLGLPAYFRAVAVTAGTVASLPFKTYRVGTRERFDGRTVLDQPNPRQTPIEFKTTVMLHAVAWGNAFCRKLRNGAGQVVQVWPIHPSRVRIAEEPPSDANPSGKVFWIRDAKTGQEVRYTDWEILHLPFMSMDGLSGVRPLEVFRQSLGIAIAGDDKTAKYIRNASNLSGLLSTDEDLDDGQAGRLRARWKALTTGVGNTGEIGVLDNGTKFTQLSLPPGDAQLLASRQWSVTEVIRMVGCPPHLAGDISNSTSWGTGIEQQVLGWVKFTLGLFITSLEQRFTKELLPDFLYNEASLEGLLRGDSASRAAFHHAAITDGWRTRNEVRILENLEPVDGLDEFIVPSNMTLISVDGQLVPLSSAGSAGADS